VRLGVDEAGKGPVLGPMVAAAVRAPADALPRDVDDSKRLSPERRRSMAAALREHPATTVGLAVVGVDRIDAPGTDMNGLTVAAHAEALAAAATGGDVVVADAADVDADRFARRVREALSAAGVDATVRAEHGADASVAHVGAASVVAKAERDARVEALRDRYGEVGSGYPSDPTTREFLREWVREHGSLPGCARASWRTSADVLAAAEQSALSEF
jgi:ribonuclease HII